MLALITLLPMLIALLLIAADRDGTKSKYIAIIASAASLALMALVSYGSSSFSWFSISGYTFMISIMVTPLNYVLLLLVLGMGLLVMIYSSGYMDTLSEQRRYYLEILSFEIAMALFAVSGNFITLFIAWEFLSITSYLLIGFWYSKDNANRAARKAITIILLGDIALLASIALFWNAFGTLEFAQIITAAAANPMAATFATLFLLVAVFTKSAQFPFHDWLIEAMEGPTPVSAYLHSSTMVKAGVFVVIILYPLFAPPPVSTVLFAFGVVTAVIATLAATREMQIKKVIAYSTVQELSIMLVALSMGAVLAAIYFFIIQTFYKALMFFVSGAVMKATGKEQLNLISGLKTNKFIYVTALIGVLSLAGFIPFSGFFAAESLSVSVSSNLAVYAVLSGISFLTSFYIFRWFSYASKDTKSLNVETSYSTIPRRMTYPMAVLAVFTIAASAIFIYLAKFLGSGGYLSYLMLQPSGLGINVIDAIVLLILISVAAWLSYNTYYRNRIKFRSGAINTIIYTGPFMTKVYHYFAVMASGLADGMNAFDIHLSDRFDMVGRGTVRAGYGARHASVGSINSYALVFIFGIIVLFLSFYFMAIL